MKRRISAVIFDFDGTIADTMPFLTDLAIELIGKNYHIPEDEAKKRYLETTGIDFAGQLEIMFPGHPNNHDVAQEFESRKLENIFAHPIFPEVLPALNHLRKMHIKTFICSSTKQEIISQYSRLNEIDDLLDGLFGFQPDFRKSNQIDFVLNQYQFDPDEVLFVGDSLRDADFATDKKIGFIGLSRIFTRSEFKKKGATSISCLDDLTKLF